MILDRKYLGTTCRTSHKGQEHVCLGLVHASSKSEFSDLEIKAGDKWFPGFILGRHADLAFFCCVIFEVVHSRGTLTVRVIFSSNVVHLRSSGSTRYGSGLGIILMVACADCSTTITSVSGKINTFMSEGIGIEVI